MRKLLLFLLILIPLLSLKADEKPLRGVWLTNVDSDVLNSRKNISEAVQFCSELNLNTIFVVTWNKGFTLYPSKVMKDLTGVEIIPDFAGRDPLKELIEEAHKKNIKVIAWFEFGFSSSYKLDGGLLLKLKPEWKSINNEGKLVSKNGFEWMNGFNPEVQDFLLSLIKEVVENYNIDGIQGDDRLPAMPSEAGYDEYTTKFYSESHGGNKPPADYKDQEWIQWRADLMTDFMRRIYETVKDLNQNIIVSMAPSIYPWSKEEYLQDWPAWLRNGYVDQVIPQIYRYNIKKYISALDEILDSQIDKRDLLKFYPGILLKVGSYYAPENFLKEMIDGNRKRDINGEVFFFYEGLKKYPEFFRNLYKE
jgi:uncharacterized lipoprotein YddW (UPF0748 family)